MIPTRICDVCGEPLRWLPIYRGWAHPTLMMDRNHKAVPRPIPRPPSVAEQDRMERERLMEYGHVHGDPFVDECIFCEAATHSDEVP